jgi:LysM repeat protein
MRREQEASVKRTLLILLVLTLALVLVACERPLREEEAVQEEPAAPLIASPMPTLEAPIVAPETGTPEAGDTSAETAPADATQPEAAPAEGTESETEASPPAAEAQEPTTPEGNIIYTVRPGDTLFSLGQRYGVTIEEIMQANNLVNPNVLDVDQQLIIPVAGMPAAEGAAAGERTHTVVFGDTLFRIGQQYGFTVDELAQYNNLANPNDLEVGQIIRIPPDP